MQVGYCSRQRQDCWDLSLPQMEPGRRVQKRSLMGCGTMVKDYGHLLRDDPAYADKAKAIADLTRDVSEFIAGIGIGAPVRWSSIKVAYHSDGDIRPIIPDLIECGLDVLNPIQPACMDPAEVKRMYGDRICLWGSIDEQRTLPFGTPARNRPSRAVTVLGPA